MKYIALVVLLLPFLASGQMPLPCLEYNNSNVGLLQGFEGEVSVNCLTIQEGDEPNVSIHNDRVRSFHVNEAQINSFFEVKNVGNGEFNIDLNPSVGFDCAWMEPNTYDVPQYDKVEWGIKLPEEIQNRIESWILNQSIDNVQPTDINPFDPDQIKIQAKIWYDQGDNNWTSSPAIIDGFYYVPFFRDMSSADKNNWDWTEIETEYTFRVRWAPVYRTSHRVVLSYWTPEGSQEFSAFYFDSTPTNPSKSFISVSDNGHYFVTKDDQLFFPTGVNFWEDVFNCRCDFDEAKGPLIDQRGDEVILSEQECAECYLKGTDDVCALLKIRKLRGSYAAKDYNNIRNMCTPLPGYLKFHERLDELKDSGGNSIRMHFNGPTFEIEFEKLNNYFDRQYQAWEFDRVLDHCKEKDIRIDLNLQIHNAVTILKYFRNNWDWNNYDNNGNPDPNDLGWCYWRELGLDPEKPLDFFTNQEAITNYKKKLRYIVARWGYSTSIYAMELFSEINNVGIGEYSFEDSQAGLSRPSGYDDGEAGVQEAVYAWHQEISGFIKNDLQHRRQLIAVEYAGVAPYAAKLTSSSADWTARNQLDFSFFLTNIDVVSISNYKKNEDRFESISQGYHQFIFDGSDSIGNSTNFRAIGKPIILGESGIMDANKCDVESGRKQIYLQPFTGLANTGYLWHGQSEKKSWDYLSGLSNFISEVKNSDLNIESDLFEPYYDKGFCFNERWFGPETVGMVNYGSHIIFGVFCNPTFNWVNDDCQDSFDELIPIEDWSIYDEITENNDRIQPYLNHTWAPATLTLENFGILKSYDIQYYDFQGQNFWLLGVPSSALGRLHVPIIPLTNINPYLGFIVSPSNDKAINYSGDVFSFDEITINDSPCSDEIYYSNKDIHVQSAIGELNAISVFSSIGKLVMSINVSTSSSVIDLENLPPGEYVCRFKSCTFKFVHT